MLMRTPPKELSIMSANVRLTIAKKRVIGFKFHYLGNPND